MSLLISLTLPLLAGVAMWSFTEYAMHNWYGHVAKGRNHFSRQHLLHHARKDFFAPPIEKALAALGASAIVFPLAILASGVLSGVLFGLGFVGMYLMYELVHWRAHRAPPTGPYSRWVRRNHFSHHFSNPKENHGVTSPIWDLVFRTWKDPGVVRVPRRHAMDWLTDAQGAVLPQFQADYVLVGGKRKAA